MFVLVAANKASFFSLHVYLSNVKCSDIFIRQIVNSVLKLSDLMPIVLRCWMMGCIPVHMFCRLQLVKPS